MSTLISSLGRRFKEKKGTGKNLNLPALPTPREVLEDIEGCQGNDPVIQLAMLIQKRGRQASSLLDKDFLAEDPSSLPGASSAAHLAFLLPYQQNGGASDKAGGGGGGVSSPVEDVGHHGAREGGGGGKRKGSVVSAAGGGSSAEHLDSYNKLKQFILLYEKSEEILDNLDGHFKRVEGLLNKGNEGRGDSNAPCARLNDNGNILQIEIKNERNDNEEEEGEWAAAGDYEEGGGDGQEEDDDYKEADSDDVCSSPLL